MSSEIYVFLMPRRVAGLLATVREMLCLRRVHAVASPANMLRTVRRSL